MSGGGKTLLYGMAITYKLTVVVAYTVVELVLYRVLLVEIVAGSYDKLGYYYSTTFPGGKLNINATAVLMSDFSALLRYA